MSKFMGTIYRNMTMKELLTLRSKKMLLIERTESKSGRAAKEVIRRETYLLVQINAEIASRVDQIPLFE